MTKAASGTDVDLIEIEQMHNGFLVPEQYAGGYTAGGSGSAKNIFQTGQQGGNALANLTEAGLPPRLLEKARSIDRDLQSAIGMGSAWLRKKADKEGESALYDVKNLTHIYSHLAFVNYGGIQNVEYDETIRSVDIAASFLGILMNFAVAPCLGLDRFRKFLGGLQQGFKAQMKDGRRKFQSFLMAQTYTYNKNLDQVTARLDGYLIDFTSESKLITTSCASYESIKIKFKYQLLPGEFNYQKLDKSENRAKWNKVVDKSDKDDLDNMENGFKDDTIARK
ncbi:hypothetical protein [Amycolatopsis australiensis]|uniref:Virulence factor Evf domain-containing protein n=1 Tax=Amycolatopsis australiensis TaxID=546364 RepID=A0A1K1RRK5_9PSEU|nr:hypothetical protein [Amycolatopsis australiensis]SFW74776.1 hypothetical protein SAMN04489730_3828 [Amycolatopsis australiensis]